MGDAMDSPNQESRRSLPWRSPATRHAHRPDADEHCEHTAIGASDGIGFGSSVVCAPFDPDCPSGTG